MEMIKHSGGCHCGRIRFDVEAPADIVVHECNCSICRMTGFQHLIVASSRFRLLDGESNLSCYTFNSGVARHYFCDHCGVKSFYVPRSNPDGYSVNARCLDPQTLGAVTVEPFDGVNWEANADELSHLSQE